MNQRIALRLCALLALVLGGVLLSAQVQLPSAPLRGAGASISPAYEGWFNNADGTHSFLIGYYNRNTEEELDIPIGPNNHFEPGQADMGQPTHFLTRRRFGMFVVTMPKEFARTQKISWTLTANGVTTTIPFYMHTDYNITPLKSSEESPNGAFNTPPVLRFIEGGPSIAGPAITVAKAVTRTATVGSPMSIDVWSDDDALYSSGGNAPRTGGPPPVNLTFSQYRGPGTVKFADARPKVEAIKGGKPDEPFTGKGTTTATFTEPGEYLIHVTANDYSGSGGGGSGCCWTNGLIKVSVRASAAATGQP